MTSKQSQEKMNHFVYKRWHFANGDDTLVALWWIDPEFKWQIDLPVNKTLDKHFCLIRRPNQWIITPFVRGCINVSSLYCLDRVVFLHTKTKFIPIQSWQTVTSTRKVGECSLAKPKVGKVRHLAKVNKSLWVGMASRQPAQMWHHIYRPTLDQPYRCEATSIGSSIINLV